VIEPEGIIAKNAGHASKLTSDGGELPMTPSEITIQRIAATAGHMLLIVHDSAQ
jgi:hypothetical protein